jgi:hypothetical protein
MTIPGRRKSDVRSWGENPCFAAMQGGNDNDMVPVTVSMVDALSDNTFDTLPDQIVGVTTIDIDDPVHPLSV